MKNKTMLHFLAPFFFVCVKINVEGDNIFLLYVYLWVSQVALVVKNLLANAGDRRKRRGFDPWVGKIPWKKKWQPTPVFLPEKIPWTEGDWRTRFHGVAKSHSVMTATGSHTQ